jgi:hypothetical protein
MPNARVLRRILPLLIVTFIVSSSWALDTTPATRPTVTDDGAYTTVASSLHASWTSVDAQSGITEYQYQIRRDSGTGAIIVDWTSTGTASSVTQTGLSLISGTRYFFAVKSRNGDGLWSTVGLSNGILVDTMMLSADGWRPEKPPREQDKLKAGLVKPVEATTT